MDEAVPRQGELTPDNVRPALGLPARSGAVSSMELPGRPPQLCKGCPHDDTYRVIKEVQAELEESTVTSDIGCYALGALPPLSVPETIICMGASITAAKGASEAGLNNVMAVIGDSTFLHSGLTGLVDCVACDTDVTIIIVDNETTAMTGGQTTILPRPVWRGLSGGSVWMNPTLSLSRLTESSTKRIRKITEGTGP